MALNRWHCSYGVTYIYLLVHKAASGSDGAPAYIYVAFKSMIDKIILHMNMNSNGKTIF